MSSMCLLNVIYRHQKMALYTWLTSGIWVINAAGTQLPLLSVRVWIGQDNQFASFSEVKPKFCTRDSQRSESERPVVRWWQKIAECAGGTEHTGSIAPCLRRRLARVPRGTCCRPPTHKATTRQAIVINSKATLMSEKYKLSCETSQLLTENGLSVWRLW